MALYKFRIIIIIIIIKYSGRIPKWSRVYSGIYRVEKKINDAVYIIRKTQNSSPLVVNVDKLKLYYGEVPTCWKKVIKRESASEHIGTLPTQGPVAGQLAKETAGAIAPNSRSERQSGADTKPPTDRHLGAAEGAIGSQSATVAAGDTTPARRPAAAAELSSSQAVAATASVAAPAAQRVVALASVADASETLARVEAPPPCSVAGPGVGRPRRQHRVPKRYYCCTVKIDKHHYCQLAIFVIEPEVVVTSMP